MDVSNIEKIRVRRLLKFQAWRSRSSDVQKRVSSSSSSNPKNALFKIGKGSFLSSNPLDSMPSKEKKPFFKLPSFLEKQRSVRVSELQQQSGDLHGELRRAKEERSYASKELSEMKQLNGETMHMQVHDKIRLIELHAEKAKESERKILESMVTQTKQFEQTKISLEEAKLDIRDLQDSIRLIEDSAKERSLKSVRTQEEMRKLRNELRLAIEAEENGRKAMDDFAISLKEVTTNANQGKAALSIRESELEKAREEAKCANSLLQSTDQKLLEALDGYHKMKLEYEESVSVWRAKEDNFANSMRISEEEIIKEKQENSRLTGVLRGAREENSRLRDIAKQAVDESIGLKDALEIARNENSQLKDELVEMGNALQQIGQDYESLKVSEAAALDSVRELKSLLTPPSAAGSNKTFSEVGPSPLSKAALHDATASKSLTKFPAEQFKRDYTQVRSRHSVGEPGMFGCSIFQKEGSLETKNMISSIKNISDVRVTSSLFSSERGTLNSVNHFEGIQFQGSGNANQKKKKTVFGRVEDALKRRSFHK